MVRHKYSKTMKVKVAREASLVENEGMENVIAQKYSLRPSTVVRWKECYQKYGEDGLSSGYLHSRRIGISEREKELEKEVKDLKEEVEILKKAAAFLADLRHG